ncbi:DinB family protein [Streptomyces sp. NBC_01356]|uniref:mycothiol transferase n=1 Tax=Streptomyces sp. NBC_01356 TaxID=2903836 RepID=UPI002E348D69|nr:DUF664 domain-containing protein [Streptomyces sp. NBC_01356]
MAARPRAPQQPPNLAPRAVVEPLSLSVHPTLGLCRSSGLRRWGAGPGRTTEPTEAQSACASRGPVRQSPGSGVARGQEKKRDTTLGVLLIRMVSETAQHAGHADVVRELVDGRAGPDHDEVGDEAWWRDYVAGIQAAADSFATGVYADKPAG